MLIFFLSITLFKHFRAWVRNLFVFKVRFGKKLNLRNTDVEIECTITLYPQRFQGYLVFGFLALFITLVNISCRSGRAKRNPTHLVSVGFRFALPDLRNLLSVIESN